MKLRGGTEELRIETGRWNGLKGEERVCKQCTQEEGESAEHSLVWCEYLAKEREVMEQWMSEQVEGFQEMSDRKKVAMVLDLAHREGRVGRAVEKMWQSSSHFE